MYRDVFLIVYERWFCFAKDGFYRCLSKSSAPLVVGGGTRTGTPVSSIQ